MNERAEGVISLLVALLALPGAMLEPRVSLGLAVAFLAILAGYKLIRSTRRSA